MRTLTVLPVVAMLALAACSAAATPSPTAAPSVGPTAAPPVATTATLATPPVLPTPVESGIPVVASDAERQLLAGARLDVQGLCTPLATGLLDAAVAAVECRPTGDVVDRAVLSLFDTQQALLAAYSGLLTAHEIRSFTNQGRCVPDHASEGGYVPGDDHGILVAERGACYLDATGMAHYIATLPPFVLVEVDGKVGDVSAVERWAWLGNQDQPGGPTIWSSSGPMSPEK
jgi:hypothetical protein